MHLLIRLSDVSPPSYSAEIEAKYQEIMKLTGVLDLGDKGKMQCEQTDLEDLGELGHGTCGQVFTMRHRPTSQIMAVKVSPKALLARGLHPSPLFAGVIAVNYIRDRNNIIVLDYCWHYWTINNCIVIRWLDKILSFQIVYICLKVSPRAYRVALIQLFPLRVFFALKIVILL